jgi:hypothetical protein
MKKRIDTETLAQKLNAEILTCKKKSNVSMNTFEKRKKSTLIPKRRNNFC